MTENKPKIKTLCDFTLKHGNINYKICIEKLIEVLKVLNFEINKNDIKTNENFVLFLKKNHLLVEEFLEYISK